MVCLGFGFGQGLFASTYEVIIKRPMSEDQRSFKSLLSSDSKERLQDKVIEKIQFETEEDLDFFLEENDIDEDSWEFNQMWRADVSSQNIEASLSAFDPLLSQQWSLFNRSTSSRFAGADIAALDAWQLTEGAGRLYVLDSGIDSQSPEVATRLVAEYNAFDRDDSEGAAFDDNSHGTHVASVAAGRKDSEGIMGAAPGESVEIVSVKMLDANNAGDTFTAVTAFNWVGQDIAAYLDEDPLNFVVINTSWGGKTYSSALESAMKSISSSRVLFVSSAGNDSQDNDTLGYWPCNFDLPHMICTAASTINDELANFSSFGKQSVHLMAPGFGILGAVPGAIAGSGTYVPSYKDKSGTSQAAPHVAGTALLAWSLNPELSASEVKNIILDSVDVVPGVDDKVLSGGRLNAYRASLMAAGLDPSQADREFAQLSSAQGGGGCAIVVRGGSYFMALTIGMALILSFLGGLPSSSGSNRRKQTRRVLHD